MAIRAFIVRPFGTKSGIDFNAVDEKLIQPALKELGIGGGTTGEIASAGNIREDMFRLLLTADLVVADMSIHNANVFYELGVRHALQDKWTFLIRCRADDVPFDLKTDRYLEYDRDDPAATLPSLVQGLRDTIHSDAQDSPVFKLLPALEAQDRSRFIIVPGDFREEVDRAEERGDLNLIADELENAKFEWSLEGLRFVGKRQFDLGAWNGAKRTWERIREVYLEDLQANMLLGTIYQKLGDLKRSNQAVERALNADPKSLERAELLSLRGSNEKTEWLDRWRSVSSEERKSTALNSEFLERSLDAYRSAFMEDLDHYYSGLNAVALLSIRTSLAKELADDWADEFDDDDEAARALEKLTQQLEEFGYAVGLSLEATRTRLKRAGEVDPWVEISVADLACVTGARRGKVEKLYRRALAKPTHQQLDAVDRQLEIFELLGFAVDQVVAGRGVVRAKRDELGEPPEEKPPLAKVLIFTGHRVDAPGRPEPRFPAAAEPVAREMIAAAIQKELEGVEGDVIGLAGGASGGDILFHEICAERKIPTTLYLACPRNEYVRASVQDAGGDWIQRFDRLMESLSCRQLGESLELPRWLAAMKDYSIWQRNNLWTLHNAMQHGPSKAVLIALWNGKEGDGPGGTGDMIDKAQQWGARTEILAAAELLKAVGSAG